MMWYFYGMKIKFFFVDFPFLPESINSHYLHVYIRRVKAAMDRKAELERKKARLAAIREEKERRRREKEVKDMEDAATRLVSGQENDARRCVSNH